MNPVSSEHGELGRLCDEAWFILQEEPGDGDGRDGEDKRRFRFSSLEELRVVADLSELHDKVHET